MEIYYLGGDASDHRNRLVAAGVKTIGISFWQLSKRIKVPEKWLVADHLPEDVHVMLDSGALSVGRQEGWSEDDWLGYVERYVAWVEANLGPQVDLVTEFDGVGLAQGKVDDLRVEVWETMDLGSRLLPVWHEEHGGLGELERLAQVYDRVALGTASLEKRKVLSTRLNAVSTKHGVSLHGLGVTRPDDCTAVRFGSVSSTSWVSPMRYGDFVLWDGQRLRRYPTKYAEQARRRSARLVERSGFDSEAVMAGETEEILRLSIWSWQEFAKSIGRRHGSLQLAPEAADLDEGDPSEAPIAAIWDGAEGEESLDLAPDAPATRPQRERHELVLASEAMPVLPTLAFGTVTSTDPLTGQESTTTLARSTPISLRQCDSCYVANSCPLVEPGSACKFQLPVEIRTREQVLAMLQTIIEMQTQRVAFARFVEELEGGYPDAGLSREIDRLYRIVEQTKEIEDNRETLKISVEGKAEAGVLSRLFGAGAAVPPPEPVLIDSAAADALLADVLDAEIID